jgi:NAD(P)-dependent dehydrogenase (short-subunit alcohol dehydrogenase family)
MAHRAPDGIAERRLALVATDPALTALAEGLRRQGFAVAAAGADPTYNAAFDNAVAAVGALDTVVWASTAPELTHPAALGDVDESRWRDVVGGSLQRYVEFLQAAERRLHGRDGRLVVVVPTLGLAGAAGLVAWATVAETQRSLAKSAARVWGAHGITVNCVAVPPSLLAAEAGDLARADLQRAALPDPDLGRDAAGAIASLCGTGMAAVTGTTIAVDGGRWMPA